MNLNKKLKCLLSAALVIIMLMSAAIAMPATAAKSDENTQAQTPTTSESTLPVEDVADIFLDGQTDLDDMASDAIDPDANDDEGYLNDKTDADLALTGETAPATEAPTEQGATVDLSTPLNPFRKGFYTNKITLKWKKLKGVDGYRVYWADMTKSSATSKPLTTVFDRSVTIKGLKPGAKYRFSIRPYITDNNGKVTLGPGSAVTASTVPNAVKNFRLASGACAGTVIKWSKVANIDGYLLYRQAEGVWSEYKYLKATATSFRDTNVKEGRPYYYRIVAYRKDTRGYLKSQYAMLRTVCGLSAPEDRGTSSRVNRVYLKWRKIDSASGYQIWYSTDNRKTFHGLVDQQKNVNTFTTKKFKTGAKVWFRIRPYRLVGAAKTRVVGTYSEFSVKILANSFGVDVGDTYIEIDISDQHLWYIVKGEIFVSTDVVTGNYNSSDTPKGVYYINNKARNIHLVGADYVSFVEYWMAFIGGSYGIHDASWRSSFGGNIYKGDGSHGCVNTPYDAVRKIYNNVSVGTPVVIHG